VVTPTFADYVSLLGNLWLILDFRGVVAYICHDVLGLDHGIGHLASISPQKNE